MSISYLPRRAAICLAAISISTAVAPCVWAQSTVKVTVDLARAAVADTASKTELPAEWSRWARIDTRTPVVASAASESVKVTATRGAGAAGVAVTNTGTEPAAVRVEMRVPAGLWRVDAALAGAETRTWRMESALSAKAGSAAKTVTVPGGATLYLRWRETVADAGADYRRLVAGTRDRTTNFLSGRLERPLGMVRSALDGLPGLVARGDREEIVRKAHLALLAAAQAQAVWKNGRSADLADGDDLFNQMNLSLSEISCAAYNLVPSQKEMADTDGNRSLSVIVTNAGSKSVPIVSLGIGRTPTVAASLAPDMVVVGKLLPGGKADAQFRSRDPEARGMVQFIYRNGAAAIPAVPLP